MLQALLWLLLPLAATSGWLVAQYSQRIERRRSRSRLNSAYGQGLNYLLNEQADKASEVLVQMLEEDPDTVELHLALGSLFRRNGEVDRAIYLHQSIIARSKLSKTLRNQAALELGRDFLKAGLLDRAEQRFLTLLQGGYAEKVVCQHLIDLYQQLKEWDKALEIGQRLVKLDSNAWKVRLAQYHCELGEAALKRGGLDLASQEANLARSEDPACVRATLLAGSVHQLRGDYLSAIEMYSYVEEQNPYLMAEVMGRIQSCYSGLGDKKSWEDYLDGLVRRHSYLAYLQQNQVQQQLEEAAAQQLRYRCEQCGLSSRKLFWQCPGCQNWGSVKPLDHEHPADERTLLAAP